MTPKERSAMQQALEALEQYQFDYCWDSKVNATITTLREALAEQAEQEPVAWMHIPKYYIGDKVRPVVSIVKYDEPEVYAYTFPLYYKPTTPVRTKDLTDEEIREVLITFDRGSAKFDPLEEFRAVIAADREKNK